MQIIGKHCAHSFFLILSAILIGGCLYPSDASNTVIHSVRRGEDLVQVSSVGKYGFGPYDIYVVIRDLSGNIRIKEQISTNNIDMSYDSKKYIYDVFVNDKTVFIKVCSYSYINRNAIRRLKAYNIVFMKISSNEKCYA